MFKNSYLKTLFLIGFCLLISSRSFSQGKFSLGLNVGIADYIGDLKYTNRNFSEWGSAVGFSASAGLNRRWQIDLGITRGTIQGDDVHADDLERAQRNLHFRNNLIELSTTFRYNILVPPKIQVYSKSRTHFTPYLFGGFALVHNNPKAKLEDQWHSLQALGTEGQFIPDSGLKPYAKIQASIPLGLGFSYRKRKIIYGLAFGYRKTFTDYLDDVSTVYPDQNLLIETNGELASRLSRRTEIFVNAGDKRGNSNSKDAYFFSTFRIGYFLGR